MNEVKWRFPGNGCGPENGLTDANSELFKKDIIAGLAREVVQNSIDARYDMEKPVVVEFDCFSVSREEIPYIQDVEDQIRAAIDTWKDTNKELTKKLELMRERVQKDKIRCLRISDFNTKGLTGVSKDDDPTNQSSNWHYLIKGSGLSNKTDTKGGSKGVGKYAAYVNSDFGTVFYSTRTIDNDEGYIGISKLCSAAIPDSPKNEKTLGIGYYGYSDSNLAISGQLNLEKNFKRQGCGTDLYIIGFVDSETWAEEIIAKLLDSFMCTIIFGDLELKVDNREIKKSNVAKYINDPSIINPKNSDGRMVIMQYHLLTDCKNPYKITVDNYGEADLYFLKCVDEYTEYLPLPSICTMVRYPYMKICEFKMNMKFPFAAMCVIGDNLLNKVLRDVENPQHTAWELTRLNDDPAAKSEITRVSNDLKNQIADYIKEQFRESNSEPVDLAGANDFIPLANDNTKKTTSGFNDKSNKMPLKSKFTFTTKKVKTINVDKDAQFYDENGNGVMLDYGGEKTTEETNVVPDGRNKSSDHNYEIGDTLTAGRKEGNEYRVTIPYELRSVKRRFVCLNKDQGLFGIIIQPETSDSDVTIELFERDEGSSKSKDPVIINSAYINDEPLNITDGGRVIHLSLTQGEKTIIRVQTNITELFSSEVLIYAHR